MRAHEVFDILEVSQMILHACLLRESSSVPLCFERSDFPEKDPEKDRYFITIRKEGENIVKGAVPHGYFGDLEEEYEKRNGDYISEMKKNGNDRRESCGEGEKHSGVRCETKAGAMEEKAEFTAIPVPCSARPIVFDREICVGCGRCAEVCQVDVLVLSPGKGAPPTVMYPGECYYCGSCVMECPNPGAIRLQHPLMNQTKFVPVKREPEK